MNASGPKSRKFNIHSNSHQIKICAEYVRLHLSGLDVIQNLAKIVFAIAKLFLMRFFCTFYGRFFIRSLHLLVNFHWIFFCFAIFVYLFNYSFITYSNDKRIWMATIWIFNYRNYKKLSFYWLPNGFLLENVYELRYIFDSVRFLFMKSLRNGSRMKWKLITDVGVRRYLYTRHYRR